MVIEEAAALNALRVTQRCEDHRERKEVVCMEGRRRAESDQKQT